LLRRLQTSQAAPPDYCADPWISSLISDAPDAFALDAVGLAYALSTFSESESLAFIFWTLPAPAFTVRIQSARSGASQEDVAPWVGLIAVTTSPT